VGNDGRFRGWFHLGRDGEVVTADRILAFKPVEAIRTPEGTTVPDDAPIAISEQLKTICMDGRSTILVHPAGGDGVYRVLAKQELKRY